MTLQSAGTIDTSGKYAYGLYAQSVGGFGGPGGTSWGLFWSFGGDANSGGSGGDVDVRNEASGTVRTNNLYSHGIFAQSIGGGGGSGGGRFALLASVGGEGAAGGNGGMVTVVNEGTISTGTDGSQAIHRGDYAHGIYAQSVGGGGGDGGGANGLVGIGGNGSGTSDGGKVEVTNRGSIDTFGLQSYGIYAQSIGGGGGDGGHSAGWSASAATAVAVAMPTPSRWSTKAASIPAATSRMPSLPRASAVAAAQAATRSLSAPKLRFRSAARVARAAMART